MNSVNLMGRAVRDPIYREGYEDKSAVARYTLAVQRNKNEADFISCVAFGKAAEFAKKYIKKGNLIAIDGRILTGKYESEGRMIYTTEVAVERHYFCGGNSREDGGFQEVSDISDDDLPF